MDGGATRSSPLPPNRHASLRIAQREIFKFDPDQTI